MMQNKVLLCMYHLCTWVYWVFSTALFDRICVYFFSCTYIKKTNVLWPNLWKGLLKIWQFLKWERKEVGTVPGSHYSLENLVFICEITQFFLIELNN